MFVLPVFVRHPEASAFANNFPSSISNVATAGFAALDDNHSLGVRGNVEISPVRVEVVFRRVFVCNMDVLFAECTSQR